MRRARDEQGDRKPQRKVWREPDLTPYDVDEVTAAVNGVPTDGLVES